VVNEHGVVALDGRGLVRRTVVQRHQRSRTVQARAEREEEHE
jgi:hypothetical protein